MSLWMYFFMKLLFWRKEYKGQKDKSFVSYFKTSLQCMFLVLFRYILVSLFKYKSVIAHNAIG